jgi:hypothetical protein
MYRTQKFKKFVELVDHIKFVLGSIDRSLYVSTFVPNLYHRETGMRCREENGGQRKTKGGRQRKTDKEHE